MNFLCIIHSDLNIEMFGNASQKMNEQLSISHLRDGLSSLTYRMGEIQSLLSKKMDRSECLTILQKKAGLSQMYNVLQQLETRIREQRKQEGQRNQKMQQISIQKINQLGKKLKSVNAKRVQKQQVKTIGTKDKFREILPQQLYIESNESMFSLLIQEISKLQDRDDDFQKQFQNRNKKIIALNNEVCSKIEKLQAEIDEKFKASPSMRDSKVMGNTWSMLQRTNKATVHKNSENNQFQTFRIEMLTKSIQNLQKQLLGKINIKDILPIIRDNHQPLTDSLQELRQYVQQSMESTRRILSSQTQINKEISMGVKLAWWHSYEQENQIAILNKEIINLVPQILQKGKGNRSNYIRVLQQGLFILKINPIEPSNSFQSQEESEENLQAFQVMIGTEVMVVGRQSTIRLQKNSEVRVILRLNSEIVVCLQKL